MSKDMDLVVSIGGIAAPSLGKAFETVKARLDSLQERSRQASSLRDVLGGRHTPGARARRYAQGRGPRRC